MKRIALIVTWAFLLAGGSLWVSQNYLVQWEPQLRSQLEDRLGKALKARVHIEHISIFFLHRVSLKDVAVWDIHDSSENLLFRAKEVALTASLIDLPRAIYHRNPLELIGLITVDTPFIILSTDTFHARRTGASKTTTPPWFALEWTHGTFQWKDPHAPHGAWTIYQSNGFFRIRGPHIDAQAKGSIESARSIDLRLRTLGKRWSLQTHLFGGHFAQIAALSERLAHKSFLPAQAKAQGEFDFDLSAGGRWPLSRPYDLASLIKDAHIKLSDVRIDFPLAPSVLINGSMALSDRRLTLSAFSVKADKNVFRLSGHAMPFAQPPQLDFEASASQLDLAPLTLYGMSTSTSTPFLQGIGSARVAVKGTLPQPQFHISLNVPQGQVGRWVFQNALAELHHQDHRWEVMSSSVRLWDGDLSLKGTSTPEQTDFQLTGNNMSLRALSLWSAEDALKGRLHFSISTRGQSDNLRTTGSFWINSFSWARIQSESIRGGLDMTSNRFDLHGASEDERIRLQIEGTRSLKNITLQRGFLQLSTSTTLSATGTYNTSTRKTRLSLDAKHISLEEAVPLSSLVSTPIRGFADLQGNLEGHYPSLMLKADLQIPDLQIGPSTSHRADATLRWGPTEFSFDTFHVDPGLAGSWRISLTPQHDWGLKLSLAKAPLAFLSALTGKEQGQGDLSGSVDVSRTTDFQGNGNILLNRATVENVPITDGALRFTIRNRRLEIPRFSLTSSKGIIDLKGHATWEKPLPAQPIGKIIYSATGKMTSLLENAPWNALCQIRGDLDPQKNWQGSLHLESPTVMIFNKASEPFEATLRWTKESLIWESMQWGRSLQSNGSIRFTEHPSTLSGQFQAQDLDLARWQALFLPKRKEPVKGLLTGHFSLRGTTQDPLLHFTANVKNGLWRAFQFQTDTEGEWKKTELDPIMLKGSLATGGEFQFQGRVSSVDETASGSLDISKVELQPIGASLDFPHPIKNKASGTLTVSGPLNQLHFAGHVEGGPLTYAADTPNPFLLQSYVMDLKLEPLSASSNAARLTITQALFKTLEEEIRFNPGSFIDFSGASEARMQVGTEIRNLHLGVFTLFGGLDINGTWQIRPQGFALEGNLFTRSLYINDYQLEQGNVQASYYHGILSFRPPRDGPSLITGIVEFQNAPQLVFKNFAVTGRGRESLRLNGTFGPQNWNFDMQGTGLDLNTLGGLAGFPYPLNGSANVKIHGAGDLEHPHVEGSLDVQDGRALGLTFQNGSAAFVWQGQRMTFTRLQLSDSGRYTLIGTGVFPLTTKLKGGGDKTIDFSVRLTDSNLGLLKSITSEVKSAKGSVQALLQIKGTSDAPTWQGSIRVKNGDIEGAHYFRRLKDFQLAADFDGNDLVLSEFHGKSGKGEFTGGGHVVFSGFEPKFYDLHVEVPSKPMDIIIPELAIPESPLAKKLRFLTLASQGDVKGHATFRGPAEAPVFLGQVNLSNGHFTFPPSRKSPPPAAFLEWVRRIRWDIDLRFSDDAWFENELAEANLIGNMAIKGTSDKLTVDGGMDITEGKISYLGIEFDIRQARFDIRSTQTGSAIETTPYVRGVGESHVQTVDPISGQGVTDTITLTINYAPINEIKPQLRSSLDPNLTQEKVLNRVTQLEVQNLTPQERSSLYQQQMVRVLDTSLATPLARSLLKRTGLVDEFHVSRVINPASAPLTTDPNNPSAGQQDAAVNFLAGTKYSVAKNLSSRLSLGYGLRFEQITNQDLTNKLDLRSDVEMSYRFVSNIYLKGSIDLPSQTPGTVPDKRVTIEPHWRFGWWGNTNKPKQKKPERPTAGPALSTGTITTPSASH